MKDLTPDPSHAVFLPAISGFYTTMLGKIQNNPDYIEASRIPAKFEKGVDGLDFLKEDSYYHYPFSLYSAGHAELDLVKCQEREPMIHKRDKSKTTLVSDSGGFQVATGILKMNWENAKKANDPEREALCKKILAWQESCSDWAMTLDVPAFAATAPLSKKTGLTKFEDTLTITLLNLDYYVKNRSMQGTKFLNVISGSSIENGKVWYEAVKKYSQPAEIEKMGYDKERTLEGYAFAGIHMKNMTAALERVLDLRDDGLLEGKDWIHFLGLGRLDWSCFLTSIQRQIRKHYNPNLQISCDAASAFVAVAYALAYNYNYFNNKKFMYAMGRAIDQKDLYGNKGGLPFLSPIADRLTLEDVCPLYKAHALIDGQHVYDVTEDEVKELANAGIDAKWLEERTNRKGKPCRTSWDTFSYLLFMSHNVYKHIEAVQEANRLADLENARNKVNWRDWTKDKKSSTANEVSDFVPHSILFFNSFVEELLDPNTKNPRELLIEFKPFLDSISFGGTGGNIFNSLFEEEDTSAEDAIDLYADLNNDKLSELEHETE